ncbi:P-loop containing nucleoside triphosphate hydrolase protein [Xylaria sp. FL1777]|nr:P-loop containing nucleoside triphosphate hydrolase protein [Xylaria sp. FL1777]
MTDSTTKYGPANNHVANNNKKSTGLAIAVEQEEAKKEQTKPGIQRDGSTKLKPAFRPDREAISTIAPGRGNQQQGRQGKTITLVDLAGSEPLNQHDKKTEKPNRKDNNRGSAKGSTAALTLTATTREEETKKINLSLHELRNVISQLGLDVGVSGQRHVCYNNSTLTKLLKYSLGFGARTLFIVCVSPLVAHIDKTDASLEFAGCVGYVFYLLYPRPFLGCQ